MATGFADLDAVTGGLAPSSLRVISARSGAGKSVLAGDLVRSAAVRRGRATLLLTRREPAAHVARRLLAAEAKVPLHHLEPGLRGDDAARLHDTATRIAHAPLHITHTDAIDLANLHEHLAQPAESSPPFLLVLDDVPSGPGQLQLLRDLHQLAQAQKLAVVAVAQEDVPRAQRQQRWIEQVADVALTVRRDDQEDHACPRLGEADFILTRHRHGPVATIVVVPGALRTLRRPAAVTYGRRLRGVQRR